MSAMQIGLFIVTFDVEDVDGGESLAEGVCFRYPNGFLTCTPSTESEHGS